MRLRRRKARATIYTDLREKYATGYLELDGFEWLLEQRWAILDRPLGGRRPTPQGAAAKWSAAASASAANYTAYLDPVRQSNTRPEQ